VGALATLLGFFLTDIVEDEDKDQFEEQPSLTDGDRYLLWRKQ
jgi:hypothetical protein